MDVFCYSTLPEKLDPSALAHVPKVKGNEINVSISLARFDFHIFEGENESITYPVVERTFYFASILVN